MQTLFLEQIRQRVPDKPLATVLSEVLNISKDSAYRRIKNEIPLIVPEVVKLCTMFNISLDQLIWLNENPVPDMNYFFSLQGNTIDDVYLSLLKRILQVIENVEEGTDVYCLTEYIPFYYLAKHPSIQKLNYYVWKRTHIRLDYNTPLISNDMSAEIERLFNAVWFKLETIHISWVLSPFWLRNFFQNISFFKKMKLITNEELAYYKNEFLILLNDMEVEASTNVVGTQNYLLLSRVAFVGTIMLSIQQQNTSTLMLFYDTNVFLSTNQNINNEQHKWIDSVCEKSIKITHEGILERKLFFEEMRREVDICFSSDLE